MEMKDRARFKTYSHLLERRRIPSDYDVVTSRLLYHPVLGFEVQTPVTQWYEKYQASNHLNLSQIDEFRDPRGTTYTDYTNLQSRMEGFVDGLLAGMDKSYEASLGEEWLREIAETSGVLRFVYHALQMQAAYLGQLAPSGRLTVMFLFQASDEMRKIQRFAYRLAMLRLRYPLGERRSRDLWQEEPNWQPLRALIEKVLITFDWSEGFVALNMAVKPRLDKLFLKLFSERARKNGDTLFSELLKSLEEDSAWQRQWTSAFVDWLAKADSANKEKISTWAERWNEDVQKALSPLMEIYGN